jgi:hypothetical protein
MSFGKVIRAALLAALVPTTAFGQAGTSAIAGVVKDATGGALPGVSIRVVNEDTGVSVDTVTNEAGLYRAPALVPGRYRIETSLDGFDPSVMISARSPAHGLPVRCGSVPDSLSGSRTHD